MYPPETVHRVAIIGTGTIGASGATHYLARGFHVTASDPAPRAEEALRSFIAAAWDTVTKLGLSAAASPDRLRFTRDIRQAVADADSYRRARRSARNSRSSCSPRSTTPHPRK